jgi:hypothetical protein
MNLTLVLFLCYFIRNHTHRYPLSESGLTSLPDSSANHLPKTSKTLTALILIMTFLWSLKLASDVFNTWYSLVEHGDTREDAYFTYRFGGSTTDIIIDGLVTLLSTIRMVISDSILVSTPFVNYVRLRLSGGGCRSGDVGSSVAQIGTLFQSH